MAKFVAPDLPEIDLQSKNDENAIAKVDVDDGQHVKRLKLA